MKIETYVPQPVDTSDVQQPEQQKSSGRSSSAALP